MKNSSSHNAVVLSRYPADLREAYQRFTDGGEATALSSLVRAALRYFMPKDKRREVADGIDAQLRLIDDLGMDSLAVAEMVFFFEDLFKVSIPSNEILGLGTVGDLETYVRGKLSTVRPLV